MQCESDTGSMGCGRKVRQNAKMERFREVLSLDYIRNGELVRLASIGSCEPWLPGAMHCSPAKGNDQLMGQVSWTQQIAGCVANSGEVPARLTSSNQALPHKQVGRCSISATIPVRAHVQHKQSLDVLWLNSLCKGDWVGTKGAALDWTLPGEPYPRWPAGYDRDVTVETVGKLCRQGQLVEAVEALGVLVQTDCCISKSVFNSVLKKCVVQKDLVLGCRVHAFMVKNGYQSDTFLGTLVLRMYASHGRLQDAMDVFEVVGKPDAFTWSAIISAHVKHGQDKQAIELYHRMRRSSVKPDGHVFVAALQACGRGADMKTGQEVHADVLASGVEPDPFVCSGLVDMYAKCGSLEDAQRVFDGLGEKDVVTWNAMIAGYSQQGMGREALRLYSAMEEEGIAVPDSVTFVCLLQACASVGKPALEKGKQLHTQVRERGRQADVFVANSLVNMYAKCGSLEDAHRVFNGLSRKDVVTWNAMLAGYSQQGMGQEALHVFTAMQEEGIAVPDSVTFICLLQACASVGTPALEQGKLLHAQIKERGHQGDVFVANSLVNMYAKCGSLEDAQSMFDGLGHKDVVTWNAMIAGYSQQGMGQKALDLYSLMQEEGIAVPVSITFVCLLHACASVGTAALEKGKQLHAEVRERGQQADVFVANSLVNMYAKCGSLEDAQSVFNGLTKKDVVTWTALIAGYSQQGMGHEALRRYSAMQEEGIAVPDPMTFVYLLQACANVAALHLGRQLHAQIEEQGLQADVFVASSLINMYGKSGSMVDAQQVFDTLPDPDLVAWNSLIAGYTCQGDSEVVFDLVQRMKDDGVQPVGITLLSVLTVCSHAGLVNKGRGYFEAMSKLYGITPTLEHHTCMVDLLGRAGRLDEALALVRRMPVLPTAAVWHTLLGACRKWSNVEVGCHAFEQAVKLDEKDASAYVLMSHIYTSAEMWEQAHKMQARRVRTEAWKQPGQSLWADMDGQVHTFSVGDEKQPQSDATLAHAFPNIGKAGYVPPLASSQTDVCLDTTANPSGHIVNLGYSLNNTRDHQSFWAEFRHPQSHREVPQSYRAEAKHPQSHWQESTGWCTNNPFFSPRAWLWSNRAGYGESPISALDLLQDNKQFY